MKIAVIGAGKIGGTIGGKWEAAGHDVVYGLRDPAKKHGARSVEEALEEAEVVLLAIPGNAVIDFVQKNAEALDGKTIIDATNKFQGGAMNSWAEIQPAIPAARLYRVFNNYGWDVFAEPRVGGQIADVFYAGPVDDMEVIEQLISDVGLRPLRLGDAEDVGIVDGVLPLWRAFSRINGRHTALRLLTD